LQINDSLSPSFERLVSTASGSGPSRTQEQFVSRLDPNRDPRFNRGPDTTPNGENPESSAESRPGNEIAPQIEPREPNQSGSSNLPPSRPPAGINETISQSRSESQSGNASEPENPGANSGGVAVEQEQTGPDGLTEAERRKVRELQRINREVRAHEQAHLAAAGPHARGGPQFEFVQGPDGRRYAVGGSVQLDTSKEDDPEQTIEKMRTVRQAALAPAEPSPQDMNVANQASRNLNEARQEQQQQQREENQQATSGVNETGNSDSTNSSDNEQNQQIGETEPSSRNEEQGGPEIEFFEDFGAGGQPDVPPSEDTSPTALFTADTSGNNQTQSPEAERGPTPTQSPIGTSAGESPRSPRENSEFEAGLNSPDPEEQNSTAGDQQNILFPGAPEGEQTNRPGQRLDLVV